MSNRTFSGELAFAASQYTREMDYWLNKLSGPPVKSYFPYSGESPGKSSTQTDEDTGINPDAGSVKYRFSPELYGQVMGLRGESDPKLHMILVAGITALLFRYTGNKDIIIGTAIYKLGSQGNFINTVLPLRNQIKEHMSFKELLLQTRQTIIAAVDHANYPVEKIVHQLNVPVLPGEFPLFDLAVLLENLQDKQHLRHIPLNMLFCFFRGDGCVEAEVEYNPRKYNQTVLEQVFRHYTCLLGNALRDLDASLMRIDIMPGEEKERLLYQVNDTTAPYPQDKTLHRLFAEQVERTPDRIALIGQIPKGVAAPAYKSSGEHLSYSELNKKSNGLAHYLREKGVQPDTIVAFMAERSIEMIAALLSILKAGGAYLPLDPDYPEARNQYILKDSGAKILLTRQETAGLSSPQAFNTSPKGTINHLHPPPAPVTSLAYLIYTSGSTGNPKGVAVEHRGVVNYIKWAESVYLRGKNYDLPLYSSLAVDLTVTSIYLPLVSGNKLFIYSGGKHEDVISGIIKENRVQVVKLTPTHLKILRNLEIHQSGIKVFIVGGEELPAQLASEIHKKFHRQVEIYNEYGPTETVVGCMIYKFAHERDKGRTVPLGAPINNTAIYLLDHHLNLVPPGVCGEIYISGEGVARGYLNNPELTAERFLPGFYRSYRSSRSYIYRSGDLARRLPGGNIEFLGRADQQIKIRGHRIEPAEIENKLLTHKKIKEAVVVPRGTAAGIYLCAYVVADGLLNTGALKERLSNQLPDYMIPLHFVQLDRLPLTAGGKLDRNHLPDPVSQPLEEYCAPQDALEEQLVEIWADILEIDRAIIGIDTNFFQLGGNSLTATVLVSRIHKAFASKPTLVDIFNRPTIRKLAGYLKETRAVEESYLSIEPVPGREYYPLSSAQKRLYILHQVEEKSILYNMPQLFQPGADLEIDPEKVEHTFRRLIQRHESLRTSFVMIDDRPVQRIHAEVEFKIEYDRSLVIGHQSLVNCQGRGEVPSPLKVDKIIRDFIRPFDLTAAPLLRVGLIMSPQQSPGFMFDMHHIISDGISMQIFAAEFIALYQGENLPPLRLQYKDYAVWQNSVQQKRALKKQEAYWLNRFPGEIPVLDLPLDFPRAAVQDFTGSRISFELGGEETKNLKRLAVSEDVSLYMLLLAVFNVLASKLGGQEDIIIGTPAAGRRHADLQHIIGMFVNTLAMRSCPNKDKTAAEFLKSVKDNTLAALENQDYPFEELVGKVSAVRDTSRNPLFDVMFVMQNQQQLGPTTDQAAETLPEKPARHGYERSLSKFDLTLSAVEASNTLYFSIEYCTKLFKSQTIERFIRYIKTLFSLVCQSPGQRIAELDILSPREKKQVLEDFNCTRTAYPRDKTIAQLYERQAAGTPHHIAVVFDRQSISYGELDRRAGSLAAYLYDRGVQPGSITAIMEEPSLEMIVGVLGILKAGAAYLPINPGYPGERIKYMLEDSSAGILLTTPGLSGEITFAKEILHAADAINHVPTPHLHLAPWVNEPAPVTSLAYILYTSGSSGTPKGVMVEHGSVVRLVKNTNYLCFKKDDRLLQTGALEFDASTFEIWGTLLNGLQLYLEPTIRLLNPGVLKETIEKNGINILWMTAPLFNRMVDADPGIFKGLDTLLVGGDRLSPLHINRLRKGVPGVNIINGYGPTENTTFSTTFLIQREYKENIPIGKPIANSTAIIIDSCGHLTPLGVTGELCLGGDGLARGYLNDPELTAEKFDHDLWDYQDYRIIKNYKIQNTNYKQITNHKLQITKEDVPSEQMLNACGEQFSELQDGSKSHNRLEVPPPPPGRRRPRIYRTGDLARWLTDGNIEFCGRMDYQVKIRGFRVEPGEIENHLRSYKEINEAVVIAKEAPGGEKHLAAYIVGKKELDVSELVTRISGQLPGYMVPRYVVPVERIPLTTNGKVDRQRLPEPGLETAAVSSSSYVAPVNETERALTGLWAQVLGIKREKISMDEDFFRWGGHSLTAVALAAKIHQRFSVKVPLIELFRAPTIRGLAAFIKSAKRDRFAPIEPVEKKEYYVFSSAQKRLLVLQQLDETSTAYNIPQVLTLNEEVDQKRLEQAVKLLIRRHESLRTSFIMVDDEPVQRIHDEPNYKIQITNYKQNTNHNIQMRNLMEDFIQPFDLSRAPLLRVGLIHFPPSGINTVDLRKKRQFIKSFVGSRGGFSKEPLAAGGTKSTILPSGLPLQEGKQQRYILVVDIHHIISDGISQKILGNELIRLYQGEPLAGLRLQYKDYAEWQTREKEKDAIKTQGAYWIKEFQGQIPVLNLPTDYIRPAILSFAGSVVGFFLGKETTERLKMLGAGKGATLYIVLLAIFNVFLSRLSASEDIIIGTPTAGRRHAALDRIIGMFVNTLALRNHPFGDKLFSGFLEEVKQRTLEAFENQEYPFEDLVERKSPRRDTGRNPLFDVMFAFQAADQPVNSSDRNGPGLPSSSPGYGSRAAKFDITLGGVETQGGVSFGLEYSTRLFKRETIQRFIRYFKNTVSAVLADKTAGSKISDLEILSEEEKQYILYEFNDTEADFPLEKTVHQLFAEQVKRGPDRIVLAGKEKGWKGRKVEFKTEERPLGPRLITYNELNEKANQWARLLKEKGVETETIVGIMMAGSIELVIGIFGILKAGGAYLPIDPGYPRERIDYMLQDSNAQILVVEDSSYVSRLSFVPKVLLNLSAGHRLDLPAAAPPPCCPAQSASLAYVIYTSGSTGRPRGVMIRHREVVNYICWAAGAYVKGEPLDFPLYSSLSFDLTVTSLFTPLLTGNRLHIYSGDHKELLLEKVVEENNVGIIKLTPSHLKLIRDKRIDRSGIKRLIVGGEELETSLAGDIFEKFNKGVEIYNEYGPTEAAVGCMIHRFNPGRENRPSVPIGIPAGNTRVYILDDYLNLVPQGVIGQLYIGGSGLARGYLNNPELTAEKFIVAANRSSRYYRSYGSYRSYVLYKTGDLARFLADGLIEFVGRVDQQVKVRGYRIEPGEIESRLLKYKNIKEAVVMVGREKDGEKFLCAYIVAAEKIDPGELKRSLAGHLPGPMIPSYIMQLEEIPLTSSGKVNHRRLPAPGITATVSYTPPANYNERILTEIWSEILGIDKDILGTSDNFFDLGGHSLKAVRLAFMIHARFGVRTPLIEIFKSSTIKKLAKYLAVNHNPAALPGGGENNKTLLRGVQGGGFLEKSPPGRRRQKNPDLVLLRETARGAGNLFLVHDGTGAVEGYIEFCRLMNNTFNCWGIQADREKRFAPRRLTIEGIAGAYIKKVKALQACGPYFITGWSIGGTIAFEMVKQWEALGEKIGFLGLIDSLPPVKRAAVRIGPFTVKSGLKGMDRMLIRARDVYVPSGKIKTILHYFGASQSTGFKHEKWNKYCCGEQTFYPVAGDHFSILEIPGVTRFTPIFDQAIAAVDAI